jgi:hypothetical protein
VRLIKLPGLVALAVIAVTASISTGSASAETLCKAAETETCAVGNRYALPQFIDGENFTGEPALLLTPLGTVKCNSKWFSDAKTNEGQHTGLSGLVEVVTFTNCETLCGSIFAENLEVASGKSWLFLAVALEQHILVGGGNHGTPAILASECSIGGFSVSCLYELATTPALFTFTGGKPASMSAAIPLKRSIAGGHSMLCPKETELDLKYKITKPTEGLWLSALP